MIEEIIKTDCVIVVDLKSIMKQRKKSVYGLSKETGIRYHIVKKYYKGDVYRVDLDILEKELEIPKEKLELKVKNILNK